MPAHTCPAALHAALELTTVSFQKATGQLGGLMGGGLFSSSIVSPVLARTEENTHIGSHSF